MLIKYASSVVGSHIDYVSALAGIDGYETEINAFDKLSADLLRVISCTPPSTSGPALQSIFGVWDPRTRIRMLRLRFFCKITCMPLETTHVRAMALSFSIVLAHAANALSGSGPSNLRPWAAYVISDLLAFEKCLGVPRSLTSAGLTRPVLKLVKLERLGAAGAWAPVMETTPDDAALPLQQLRARSIKQDAFGVDYATGKKVFVWEFPVGTSIHRALHTWSVPLRRATYVTLRWLGNLYRNRIVFEAAMKEWAGPALRDFTPLKSASYAEPLVFLIHVEAARRLLHARVGKWGEEVGYRRMPRGKLHRIENPADRACYLCPADSWMPETLAHLLFHCPHADMVRLRASIRVKLTVIAAIAAGVPGCPPAPDFASDVQLYVVLMLCTGVGTIDPPAAPNVLVQHPVHGAAAAVVPLDVQRRDHAMRPLPLHAAVMRPAARWVSFLTGRWRAQLSEALTVIEGAAVGARLVSAVCAHSQRVSRVRRRLLRGVAGFAERSRDPARPARAAPAAPAAAQH